MKELKQMKQLEQMKEMKQMKEIKQKKETKQATQHQPQQHHERRNWQILKRKLKKQEHHHVDVEDDEHLYQRREVCSILSYNISIIFYNIQLRYNRPIILYYILQFFIIFYNTL